ncbi:hypothetical protein [Terrimonas pollutisoli]|uniref:hypothetical protein n=1 Tax=Terrimonas pollutisoli TaxID=3034147 RepID=UPI0023ED28CB|nr:hypothetical protein [Terrimonas sp. H1YJ31]
MKIWKGTEKNDDKIIAFFNQTIYKANPKSSEVENYITELKINSIPEAKALEIPLSYIKEISLQEGQNHFNVQFGANSSEHFVVSDSNKKMGIFEHFEKNLPVEKSIIKYSKVKSAKKPLIAMIVVTAIFLWTLTIAIGIEGGNDYTVVGQYRSVAGIVLALAYLGVAKVVLIFGGLFLIASVAFIKKFKSPPTVHRLVVKR